MGTRLRFGDVLKPDIGVGLGAIDDARLIYVKDRPSFREMDCIVLVKSRYIGWRDIKTGLIFQTYRDFWVKDEEWPNARPTTGD